MGFGRSPGALWSDSGGSTTIFSIEEEESSLVVDTRRPLIPLLDSFPFPFPGLPVRGVFKEDSASDLPRERGLEGPACGFVFEAGNKGEAIL